MFRIIAQNGASAYAPDNTLAAFYKGLDLGANGIATDLHMTKDGVAVLFHDNDLGLKTDGKGTVGEQKWADLKKLDAGSWFSNDYAGERLLSLEEFLYYFSRKNIYIELELKEEMNVKDVLNIIGKYTDKAKVTITSEIYESLEQVRELDKGFNIGYLVPKISSQVLFALKNIKAQQVCPYAEYLTKEQVMVLKKIGYIVRAHKVETEDIMMHALSCGVDGMAVKFPDVLAKALKNENK